MSLDVTKISVLSFYVSVVEYGNVEFSYTYLPIFVKDHFYILNYFSFSFEVSFVFCIKKLWKSCWHMIMIIQLYI
jgi:hypothetical protein